MREISSKVGKKVKKLQLSFQILSLVLSSENPNHFNDCLCLSQYLKNEVSLKHKACDRICQQLTALILRTAFSGLLNEFASSFDFTLH